MLLGAASFTVLRGFEEGSEGGDDDVVVGFGGCGVVDGFEAGAPAGGEWEGGDFRGKEGVAVEWSLGERLVLTR